MIIVFEGPDAAGKSTMIEAVAACAEADGVPVARWHRGPFPAGSTAWAEYFYPLTTLAPTLDWLVLIDRWHVGELVYGPMFRGQSQLSLLQRDYIEGYLKQLGAVMIYLKASLQELTRRLTERGDDMVRVEHLAPLLYAYDAIIADGHQPRPFTRTYDTTGNKVEPTAAAIYAVAKMDTGIAISSFQRPVPYWEEHEWPT